MGTIIRGIKNISRNKSRNIAMILTISILLSLVLMMINMDFSSNHMIKSIKRRLGNRFDVWGTSPREEEVGSIDESLVDEILKIDSVKSINRNIEGIFHSKKLKPQSGETKRIIKEEDGDTTIIEEIQETTRSESGEEISTEHTFYLYGTEDASMIPELQENVIILIKGNLFKKTDIEQNVALVEKHFAERNRLKVGSEFIVNTEKIKVCGIYEYAPSVGGNEIIYIPFKTAQRLLDFEGKTPSLTVTVDSIDDVEKTMNYINNVMSDGKMMAGQNIGKYQEVIISLGKIKNITKITMISTFTVGILIILLIMFINVRQRTREIGILKAIGASNLNISSQFLVESITLCIIALIISTVIILGANQIIANFIVQETSFAPELISEMKSEMEEGLIETSPLSVELGKLEIIFSPQILIFAILLTFLLGIVGSLLPAYYISKLRPAEVLRFE